MSGVTLHHGDNRESLRALIQQGVRVHSVITDPPYGLVSVTKRFGSERAAAAKFGSDGAFARASAGFMGSKWDGTGIERDPEFWKLVYDILLPGGYIAAFSSSRTYHRMACAIEDAGFVTHPMKGWVFGSGMPKAHNAAMAIDRQLGVTPGFVPDGDPVKRMIPGAQQHATGDWTKSGDRLYQPGKRLPGSPEAAQWDGWAYGGQADKPALEPIYVGQKPFSEKNGALNLLTHGVGAINIDGCRAGDRHPANLIHDGSPEAVALFPAAPGQIAKASTNATARENQNVYGDMARGSNGSEPRADHGSAARFFNCFPADGDPIRYQAKASKSDRAGSKHPTVKPVALMEWLVRMYTPMGGIVLDPFAGSGTTGEAARRVGVDSILMEGDSQFARDIASRFGLSEHNLLKSNDDRDFPIRDASCDSGTYGEHTDLFDDLLGGDATHFADLLG